MRKIKELLVVEGKHDVANLAKYFECDTICTNGLALDSETLDLIKKASEVRDVIILTDPDYPGTKIRNQIKEYAPKVKHVFVEKKKAIGKRNVGIEYMSEQDILSALENVVEFSENEASIEYADYLKLGLYNDKIKREYVAEKLHLGHCNSKTMFKRLNMINVSYEMVEEILKDYE